MHHLAALHFLLPGVAFSSAPGDGGGGCGRQCNGTVVPYPFGFSGDCPVILSCNAASSTALLPHSAAPVPYPILSFNSTASTFVVSVAPLCNRSVLDASASLTGAGYSVSSRTGIFLHGGCRAPAAASNCAVPEDAVTRLLRTAQCAGGGNETSWTCVVSPPTAANSSAAAEGRGQFLDWASVQTAGCDDALTATVYGEALEGVASLDFGVAELGWWLNGTCAGAGQCAENATCHDVETPSGGWGHRCMCLEGMSGDGFAAGEGCHYRYEDRLPKRGKLPVAVAVAAGVSVPFILLTIGLTAWFLLQQRKRRQNAMVMTKASKQAPNGAQLFRGEPVEDDLEQGEETGPRRFRYDELAAATGNFSDDRRLGRGGFGSVYRGFLTDTNRDVAMKRVSETSRQGWKEFVSEVRIISRLRHRNLVQLIGWCHGGDDELLLVYELMHSGSLDAHLYKTGNPLTWPVRYGIALGVGAALLYLHQEAERRVVHRDVKPSNVMLDSSFTAKLGDFGMTKRWMRLYEMWMPEKFRAPCRI